MLQTTVLPIEYDDKHKQEAEQLKELLEGNQMLFQMFLTDQKKISFQIIFFWIPFGLNNFSKLEK